MVLVRALHGDLKQVCMHELKIKVVILSSGMIRGLCIKYVLCYNKV